MNFIACDECESVIGSGESYWEIHQYPHSSGEDVTHSQLCKDCIQQRFRETVIDMLTDMTLVQIQHIRRV